MDKFRKILTEALVPIIGSKCVLLDLPYYENLGDTLIWEGVEEFLIENQIECLYRCSCLTYKYRPFSHDVTILLMGGGNFGDLWRELQDFRNTIIESYPNNRIVVLPQSVCYHNQELLLHDSQIAAKHPDLYLCARDNNSFKVLKDYFSANTCLLLPDMALFAQVPSCAAQGKSLFICRNDKERLPSYNQLPENDLDTSDWPTNLIDNVINNAWIKYYKYLFIIVDTICRCPITPKYKILWIQYIVRISLQSINREDYLSYWQCCKYFSNSFTARKEQFSVMNDLTDWVMYTYVRTSAISLGAHFLAPYSTIYSSRLHGCIMALLLGNRNIYCFDSLDSKILHFYDTWLKDFENVKMLL